MENNGFILSFGNCYVNRKMMIFEVGENGVFVFFAKRVRGFLAYAGIDRMTVLWYDFFILFVQKING